MHNAAKAALRQHQSAIAIATLEAYLLSSPGKTSSQQQTSSSNGIAATADATVAQRGASCGHATIQKPNSMTWPMPLSRDGLPVEKELCTVLK
mmetsp:Transcript_59083/g.117018  ORF Transcript_59083/g.117018 Transcript_59083/m.117018 type:complete len:93 (+) Transcript_59083:107-385(+)